MIKDILMVIMALTIFVIGSNITIIEQPQPQPTGAIYNVDR